MAEERFDEESVRPISETDLEPINPLTPKQVLDIGQIYTASSVNFKRIGRKMEEEPDMIDREEMWSMHYEAGRNDAIRKVLQILGQDKLISKIDEGLKKLLNLP